MLFYLGFRELRVLPDLEPELLEDPEELLVEELLLELDLARLLILEPELLFVRLG